MQMDDRKELIPPTQPDAEAQQGLYIDKLSLLYKNLLLSVPASFLCAALVFFGLYHETHRTMLINWFYAVILISLFRLITYYLYRNKLGKHSALTLFILGAVISAILWGVCAYYLMPLGNSLQQMIIIVVIAGVTAGGVQTLQASFITNFLYMIAILVPLCMWFFLQTGTSYFILGLAMTLYLFFMLVTAKRGYSTLEQSLLLRYENAGLVKNLSVANQELLKSYHTIEEKLTELQKREVEMRYISKTNEMLQTCQKSNDAYSIICHSSEDLFPNLSGGLVIFETTNQSMHVRQWGKHQNLKTTFAPEDCCALREGHPYIVNDPEKHLICKHFESKPAGGYICLPLILQTGAMGILVLCAPADEIITLHEQQLANTFNDTIKLSLANIRLHEVLSEQSIHDPLTGLYNRRFLDETLPRELMRTIREKSHLCICMIDVDFFKHFNDTSGHEAGDIILKFIGKILEENFRGGDIACRFGGDEFILVLVDSNISFTLSRLEDIREKIKRSRLSFHDTPLPQVTISIGVAEAPKDGAVLGEIMRAADNALYKAKKAGRDRIEVFGQNGSVV